MCVYLWYKWSLSYVKTYPDSLFFGAQLLNVFIDILIWDYSQIFILFKAKVLTNAIVDARIIDE